MSVRKAVAATMIVTCLGAGAIAFAPAAGAQTTTDPGGRKEQACARAHDAWERLVAANERVVARYRELREKQQELLDAGHRRAAHRLDVRLDAARRRHEQIKAKVLEIAARVRDRCSEDPPALTEP